MDLMTIKYRQSSVNTLYKLKPQVEKSGPVQAQNTKTTPAAPTPAAISTNFILKCFLHSY